MKKVDKIFWLTVLSLVLGLAIMLATEILIVKIIGVLFMIPFVVFRIKNEVIDYGRKI